MMSTCTRWLALAASLTLGACVGSPEETQSSQQGLRGDRSSAAAYEDGFVRARTEIGPTRVVQERVRAESSTRAEVDALIDATEGRTEFPLLDRPRAFENEVALQSFLESELGMRDGRGSYAVLGTPRYSDPSSGIEYHVLDPIAAFLGGRTGEVVIGGARHCIDPDGRRDDGVASYLEPQGELTRPSDIYFNGTSGVVGHWHSFYNKTYFPWPWARHGANASINVAPLPSTRIIVNCDIWTNYGGGGGLLVNQCGVVDQTNVGSAETAQWTGWTGNWIFDAEAVCGYGEIRDVDITLMNQIQLTGNGPSNNLRCGV